jgi:hypothetical protein
MSLRFHIALTLFCLMCELTVYAGKQLEESQKEQKCDIQKR